MYVGRRVLYCGGRGELWDTTGTLTGAGNYHRMNPFHRNSGVGCTLLRRGRGIVGYNGLPSREPVTITA